LTLEHLWGDWVAGVIYVTSKKRKKARRITPVTPHEFDAPPDESSREWKMPSLSSAARISCEQCNHGWIENFDHTARTLLTSMMRGERTTLDEEGQRLIARWIAKTAMVFMHTSGAERRPIPPSHYRYLRDHQRPPPSAQVWIGARTAEEGAMTAGLNSCFFREDPESREESGRAYIVAVGIGHLVGVLFGHNLAFEIPWPTREGLEQIWPVVRPIVEWPPEHIIGDVEELARDPQSGFERHLTDALARRGIRLN
jgi:hypothetical protein